MPYKDPVKRREANRRAQKKRRANPESEEDLKRTEWLRHKNSRAARNRKNESYNRKIGHLPRRKGKNARPRIDVTQDEKAVLKLLGPKNNRYIYFSQDSDFTWSGFVAEIKRLLPDISSQLLLKEAVQHTYHGRKWQFRSNGKGEPYFVVSRNNGISMDDLHKLTAEFKGYIASHSNRFPILNAEDGWRNDEKRAQPKKIWYAPADVSDGEDDEDGVIDAGGGYKADSELRRQIEQAAVQHVTDVIINEGWSVESVEAKRCGYDLHCTKGDQERHVEVKGTQGSQPAFIITVQELRCSVEDDAFELWVVAEALANAPKAHRYSGAELSKHFQFQAVQYRAVPNTTAGGGEE